MTDPGDSDVEELEAQVSTLTAQVQNLQERVQVLEAHTSGTNAETSDTTETPVESPADTTSSETVDTPETEPASTPPTDDSDGEDGFVSMPDIESVVGIKLIGVTGGIALIIAALFLVQLAITEGYIGPLARVTLAATTGLGMMVTGRYVARTRNSSPWSEIVVGTGAIIAYIAVFASHGYTPYREAIGTPAWLSLIVLTGLVAAFLVNTVRHQNQLLAAEGSLLLWITVGVTLNFSMGDTIFSLYLVTAIGTVLAVARLRAWTLPSAVSVVPAYLTTYVWFEVTKWIDTPAFDVTMLVGVFAVFVTAAELSRRTDPDLGDDGITWTNTLPALSVTAALSTLLFMFLTESAGTWIISGATLLIAGVLAGQYYTATELRRKNAVVEPYAMFLAAGVGLAVLGDDTVRVAGLAVMVFAALAASKHLTSRSLGNAALLTAIVLFVDAVRVAYIGGDLSVLPVQAQTANAGMFAVLTTVFYSVFALSRGTSFLPDRSLPGVDYPVSVFYGWGGTVLVTLLCDTLWSGVWLSLAWSTIGFTSIAIGTVYAVRKFRIQGILLLGATSLKVFIFDTSGLDPVPRILSFIVLGVILLITSYFYSRTRDGFDITTLRD